MEEMLQGEEAKKNEEKRCGEVMLWEKESDIQSCRMKVAF